MADKMKTVLLAVLVATSLLQSYLLIYDRPDNQPLNRTEYVRTELKGLQVDVGQLIFPRDMVIHFGNNEHSMLFPGSTFFELILKMMKEKHFEDAVAERPLIQDFAGMRREAIGIELRYMTPTPLELVFIDQSFPFDQFKENTRVKKIWFYQWQNQTSPVNLMLFTEDGVYEIRQNAVLGEDLRQYVRFGQFMHPKFETNDGEIYVPSGSVQVGDRIEIGFGMFSSEQLRNSLFADPGISRSILQSDGTEMITDGKRGLEIDYTNKWMSFNDPIALTDQARQVDLQVSISSAVQFVNQHGGWNGKYLLSDLAFGDPASHEFRFTQIFDGLPVVTKDGTPFGSIKVSTRQGTVTEYERSLINLNVTAMRRERHDLPGGPAFSIRLDRIGRDNIAALFPAYVPVFAETHISLVPRWVAQMKDGRLTIVDGGA